MARYSKALTARAMGAFVASLESGAGVEAAAAEARVAVSTLYCRRERDEGFARAWDEAVAKSSGPVLVWNQAKRRYQKQASRRVRFGPARKQVFLDHFAGSCNLAASAAAAGVCTSSVHRHLARDAAFAEAFQAALEIGYRLLEAEALEQARLAQAAYRIDPASPEGAMSFDKAMQLLREYKRGQGKIGLRPGGGRRPGLSFGAAVALLEKRLTVLGVTIDEDSLPPLADDRAAA